MTLGTADCTRGTLCSIVLLLISSRCKWDRFRARRNQAAAFTASRGAGTQSSPNETPQDEKQEEKPEEKKDDNPNPAQAAAEMTKQVTAQAAEATKMRGRLPATKHAIGKVDWSLEFCQKDHRWSH